MAPSIFQPLHEKDADLVAQSTPGVGSRSLAAAAPASAEPTAFPRDNCSDTLLGTSPLHTAWGSQLPSASIATASLARSRLRHQGDPQPCCGLLLDVGPCQVSSEDAQPAARSHHTARRLPRVLGEHRSHQKCTTHFPLTVSSRLEAPPLPQLKTF